MLLAAHSIMHSVPAACMSCSAAVAVQGRGDEPVWCQLPGRLLEQGDNDGFVTLVAWPALPARHDDAETASVQQ
jgi:hypothetical protein